MRRPGEAGFTLIEALIAMIILIFGIVAVANLIVVAVSSNRLGSTSTATTELASETMERLKDIPWRDLQTGGDLLVDKGTITGCEEPAIGAPATGQICVVAGNFNYLRTVPGVAQIKTRWTIAQVNNVTYFIRVRSEASGLAGAKRLAGASRAEFTTFRSCTALTIGCPAP